MAHILKNSQLEVHIDSPDENYNHSRFDWTGKITVVKYKDKYLSDTEIAGGGESSIHGKGFYNEFGINTALAYQEAQPGGWFHKIGVGLLRKEEGAYDFQKAYDTQPGEFETSADDKVFRCSCKSASIIGYAYLLKKEIALLESGFEVRYKLHNTGAKPIVTNEYNHNFLSINKELIGPDYILKFPFLIEKTGLGESVNPENLVDIGQKAIRFKGQPSQQFFFSNLSGGAMVEAKWALENVKSKMGISETGSFQTNSINLWGWGHVISPELFLDIVLPPGQSTAWSRTYQIYEIA